MPQNDKIEILIDNLPRTVSIGAKLSEILAIDMPCAGKGKCGKCKVVATGRLSELCESERKALTESEIKSGTRLACQCFVLGACSVFTGTRESKDAQILTDGRSVDFEVDPSFQKLGVAIDVGTTTLASSLFDASGKLLATKSELNPQGRFGADVISRIEASLAGKADELADSICRGIDALIISLCAQAGVPTCDVESLVITGNTAMLYFLTKTSPSDLSKAPFIAKRYFGETLLASDLGLSSVLSDTKVYLPPCIAAFVGADTVCAILASGICDQDKTSLLVDIGTNGEMALVSEGKISVCSTAAGPAFEGVGISMGMRAAPGAIDKVSIVNGNLFSHVIGNAQPIGICGSGLIDATAALLDLEALDETGFLEDETITLSDKVTLSQEDIRMLQLAKSAIYSGICTLMRSSGVGFDFVSSMLIAGGFGNYLNMKNAARVGLIPGELLDRISVIGNAALAGASMLLLNEKMRENAKNVAKNASVVELSSNPVFSELYMENMLFD